ncbi:MAG: hypothetical protein LC745_04365 [Planctomycetia bacterium]|nr:hypothetical protein [Planctomycetia bacterium]
MQTPTARRFVAAVALAVAAFSGCRSPEDGRPRGGGHGGDGGNYRRGAIHVPSKIDGTKSWADRPRS